METFEYRIQMKFPEGRNFRTYEHVMQLDEKQLRDYCSVVSEIPDLISLRVWRRPISTWYPYEWDGVARDY